MTGEDNTIATSHRQRESVPTKRTVALLRQGAQFVAAGRSFAAAARALGIRQDTFHCHRKKYHSLWERELKRARESDRLRIVIKPLPGKASRKTPVATERSEAILQRAAAIVATGKSISDAALLLDLKLDSLRRLRNAHAMLWGQAVEQAVKAQHDSPGEVVIEPLPVKVTGQPTRKTLNQIRRATAMIAAGLPQTEVVKALKVRPGTIVHWQNTHQKHWETEYDRAMEATVIVIRRQAGTDAVLEDPEGYVRSALVCERWARKKGRGLFPTEGHTTLKSFYETYYKPVRLSDVSGQTVATYESVIRLWCVITGDPPLGSVTAETLASFRNCIARLRGKQPASRTSPNTVRKYLRHLQAILDKAGPPGRRNRDAANLIPDAPWVKPPKARISQPRIVLPGHLSDTYTAAVAMNYPRIQGFKPPAWWRALLVVAFNTGLRRRTLFEMRIEEIDWDARCIRLPAKHMKAGRPHIAPLNHTAIEHLLAIRTDRELVFPWPYNVTYFDQCFHRLQDAAGIPREEHFGLHTIRKTLGTILYEVSPGAAQMTLGHMDQATTRNHYVRADQIVTRALDQLKQPDAFVGNAKGSA